MKKSVPHIGTDGADLKPLSGDFVYPFLTSREWDSEAGQYYYRERYYLPKVGRFGQRDLLKIYNFAKLDGGYIYVKNNPINYIDPTGLKEARIIFYSGSVEEQAYVLVFSVTDECEDCKCEWWHKPKGSVKGKEIIRTTDRRKFYQYFGETIRGPEHREEIKHFSELLKTSGIPIERVIEQEGLSSEEAIKEEIKKAERPNKLLHVYCEEREKGAKEEMLKKVYECCRRFAFAFTY